MANINLRTYIKEVDDLIEEGQEIDEAIAHCRHILKSYPKHIDTYRLLGKSYLESKRYGDAGDLFQRVLSAIPDDFVSHVGMAIIREDEGNLDAAIWHMERASEAKPGNPAIEQELKRIIGKRDGIEPQRVRPTRGALARMYYHGELFSYATSELRTALEEDPDRPDLQLLLADSYWRTDKRLEAAELCRQILEKLPYCRDANRITAALLQTSGRPEEAAVNLRRLISLDPYEAFVDNPMDDPNAIEASAVQLERLEWIPGQPMPSSEQRQPDWAASLGVDLRGDGQEAEASSEMPSWLQSQGALGQEQTPASETELPSPIHPFAGAKPPVGADIPDWMRDAGWVEGSGEATEGPMEFQAPEPDLTAAPDDRPLEPAQLPSWLNDISPERQPTEQPIPESPPPQESEEESALPGWIEEMQSVAGAVASEITEGEIEQAQPEAPQTLPDAETQREVEEESEGLIGEDQETEEGVPDYPPWLEPSTPGATDTIVTWLGDKSMGEAAESSEDIPSWMRGTGPLDEVPPGEGPHEDVDITGDTFAEIEQSIDESAGESPEREIPPAIPPGLEEAFKGIAETGVEPIEGDVSRISEGRPNQEAPEWLDEIADLEGDLPTPEGVGAEEAPDWLSGLSDEEGQVSSIEDSAETPMWLDDAKEQDLQEAVPASEAGEISQEWLNEVIGEEDTEFEAQEEAKPEWLEGFIEAEKSIQDEEPPDTEVPPGWLTEMSLVDEVDTSPREEADEPPEWLKGLTDVEDDESPEPQPAEETPPDWVSEATFNEEEAATIQPAVEESPEWLQELSVASTETGETFDGTPQPGKEETTPQEETPDWLQEFREVPPEAQEKKEPAAEEIPQPSEAEVAAPEEEIPEWLQDLDEVPTEPEEPSMEPVAQAPVSGSAEEVAEGSETPEWLQNLGEIPQDEVVETPQVIQETTPEMISDQPTLAVEPEEEAPPLMEEIDVDKVSETPTIPVQPIEEVVEAPEVKPPADRIEAAFDQTPTKDAQIIPAEEAPDWLQEIPIEEVSIAGEQSEESVAPEWLQEIEESEYERFAIPEEEIRSTEEPVSDLGEPPEASDEELVWHPEFAESETPVIEQPQPSEIEETGMAKAEVEESFDWLQEAAQEIVPEPQEGTEAVEAVAPGQHVEEISDKLETPMGDEEVFSFLEGLAARENGEVGVEEPSQELITDRQLQMDEGEEEKLIEEHIIPEELDESLVWLEQLASEEPAQESSPPIFIEESEGEIDTEVPDWLEEVAEKPDQTPDQIPTPRERIVDEIAPEPEPPQPEPSSMETIVSERFAEVMPEEELIPEEPFDLKEEKHTEVPSTAPEKEPEPMVPETESPVMDVQQGQIEQEDIPEIEISSIPEPAPETPAEPRAISHQDLLDMARSALGEGNIEGALSHYANLIEEKAELEAVIEDLQTAISRTPKEPMLWQILGDALMKTGQLTNAIDAYRRGMETV